MRPQEVPMNKSSIALQVLLSGNSETLWLPSCKREVLRLLRHANKSFDQTQLKTLIDAIMKGPPRSLYKDMPDEEWAELRDNSISHRLKKLQEAQITLPVKAKKLIERVDSAFKERRKGEISDKNTDHKDEFSFYMSSGWSDEFDYGGGRRKTPEQIKEMSPEDFEEYFLKNQDWDESWMNYCKAYSKDAFAKLENFAKKNKKWPHHRWSSAFHCFRQQMVLSSEEKREYTFDKKFAEKVLKSISNLPVETLKKPQVSLEAAKFIDFRTFSGEAPDKLYWSVWENLWYASIDLVEDGDYDLRTKALNTACGELAEQLIYHASNLKLQKGEELPEDLSAHANIVVTGNGHGALIGRVMLVSRLSFFFNVSPNWSKKNLVPLLSREHNPNEWMQMWLGFMWSPRVQPNLYVAIKDSFFDLIEHIDSYAQKFDEDRYDEAERVAQLLGYLCIPENTRITRQDAKILLNKLNSRLLCEVAFTLKSQLSGAGKDKAAKMWLEQIKPWFIYAWPKKNFAREGNVSDMLASMALNTEEAFPDCVKTLSSYLGKIHPDDRRMLLFRLSDRSDNSKESDIPRTYPKATLELLHKLVHERPTWHNEYLRDVLDIISKAEPTLKKSQKYKELRKIAGA